MKLIVNADDWALEPLRDKAIVECFHRGWLDQTTAVMNRPGLEQATELARREGLMDRVGLHVNLIYGRPLTEGLRRCPLFCDADGLFNARFHMSTKSRLWLASDVKRLVADEVRAQARLYKRLGYGLLHADSHQHAHNDFSITPVIVSILKEEGFRTLRIARNIGPGLSSVKKAYKALFNGYLKRTGLAFTDYFGSIADFRQAQKNLPKDATVELMCHPMWTIGSEERADEKLSDFYKPFDGDFMEKFRQEVPR